MVEHMSVKLMEQHGRVVGWEVEITRPIRDEIQRWLDEKPGRTPADLHVALSPDRSFVQISGTDGSSTDRVTQMPGLPDILEHGE
jgi:hypothetical protein